MDFDTTIDFNTTEASSPSDILKVMILERWRNALESIESYYKLNFANAKAPINVMRARILSLFVQLSAGLKRHYKDPNEYKVLLLDIQRGNPDELIEAFYRLNQYLDDIKITRVDLIPKYNRQIAEISNRAKGF